MWIFGRHKHLAEEKLSEYVSGRLPPYQKERLERSMEQCVTCRQELESLQMTASLLRELPAHELPRSFVFAAAPATATPVPAMGVNATRSWTFRTPGWAYAGAASVVGLAVAVFVLSSEVSLWLPGTEREPPQSEAAGEFPAQPASPPAPMPLAEERLASVPPLPEVAADVAVMAESGSTSDAPAPAAPAASDSSSAARQEMMDIPPTPAPEAALLAPESYEASVRDLAPGEASSEATMEQAPAEVPAAVPMAEEQVEGVAAEPNGTSDDVGEIADLEPPTASPAMAMAKESPQEQAAALAPPLDSDQPGAAAESMQPAAVSPEPTLVPGKQESQPAKKVEVIASSEPGVAARVGGSMAEPEQAAESPKQDSSQVNAGERVAEGASLAEPGLPATLPPKPADLASAPAEIEPGEQESSLADSPGAPSSVPELGKTEPGVSEENLSKPATIASDGAPGTAGAQGLPEVGGEESEDPVGPQGSPAIGATEEHATVATEPREGSVGDSQSPQPSSGNGDAAIPGFSIRYEVLFAMAATAAVLILLLALFGLYRFWLGRHARGKPGTNGGADPSLLVNRPKLGNGGG